MPFTGSHPAAVLPFFRTGLVPAALVIGSMAPDLPYYLPVRHTRSVTHSAAGIVGVDLAMGLVCFALWVWLLAPAALAIAGEPLRRRLPPGAPAPLGAYAGRRRILLVVASLVLGSATHVVWDAFTHVGAWGPEHIAWLAGMHGPLPGYRWLQYASGVFGATVLSVAFARWWRRTPPSEVPRHLPTASPRLTAAVWAALAAVVVLAGLLGGWWGYDHSDGDIGATAFRAATIGGAAGALMALSFAVWWKVGRRGPQA